MKASVSHAKRLAVTLLREREAERSTTNHVWSEMTCVACDRTFTYRAVEDYNTRFCSLKCCQAYDNGFPAHASKSHTNWFSQPVGLKGFYINCSGCGKRFDSIGLKCCSVICEQ